MIEIIVVDNASSDGSPELIKHLYPDVKVIENDVNYGFAKANNIGIKECSGRYICLLNSDVEILEGCFERIMKYMDQHPDIGILGPMMLNADRSLQRTCREYPTLWNTFCRAMALDTLFPKSRIFGGRMMLYWSHETQRDVDVINGCFWMVKRESLKNVGLLDESFFMYAEDVDWCKRFKEGGWRVCYYPDAKAIHYGGASSSFQPIRFYLEMQRANIQYWKKHHSGIEQFTFWMIMLFHHLLRSVGEIVQNATSITCKGDTRHKIDRSIASVKWMLSFNYEARVNFDK